MKKKFRFINKAYEKFITASDNGYYYRAYNNILHDGERSDSKLNDRLNDESSENVKCAMNANTHRFNNTLDKHFSLLFFEDTHTGQRSVSVGGYGELIFKLHTEMDKFIDNNPHPMDLTKKDIEELQTRLREHTAGTGLIPYVSLSNGIYTLILELITYKIEN